MRFWFVHSGEVSIREQIVTQITLGILSDELSPGERLPSTRELARRFHLHPNTVSAAYKQLEAEGWVNSRRGSGVFVRSSRPVGSRSLSPSQALDHVFAHFLTSARKLNIPSSDIRNRLQQWLDAPKATHLLLIEPGEALRSIVLAEIQQAVPTPISACSPEDPSLMDHLRDAVPMALPSKAAMVRSLLPNGTELMTLQVRSPASSLAEWLPAPSSALVGIASAWPQFLEIARTMLVAAGFAPDALIFRNSTEDNWIDGLTQTAAVVCDTHTALQLPKGIRAIPFPLLAEASLEELKRRHLSMVSSDT
jgi:GntR family transcriptional regulator